jgi:polyhydroxyalkanoate synthesis regulator phasin
MGKAWKKLKKTEQLEWLRTELLKTQGALNQLALTHEHASQLIGALRADVDELKRQVTDLAQNANNAAPLPVAARSG